MVPGKSVAIAIKAGGGWGKNHGEDLVLKKNDFIKNRVTNVTE